MSIVSTTGPGTYQSIQDSLYHSALSDASGMPDFKYVFDVYANNNQLTRVKLFPDPTYARGYFDAGPSVRNEMSYEWLDINYATGQNMNLGDGEVKIDYDIRFGEEYISGGTYVSGSYVSGGTLVTLLNQASATTTAYNYAAPLFKRKTYTINSMSAKFLSNRPLVANCRITDKFLIPFYKAVPETYFAFTIRLYNESNTNYSSWTQYNDISIDEYFYTNNGFPQLNIGPKVINVMYNRWHGTDLITSACKYYTVTVSNANNSTPLSNTFRINIDCNPKYDAYNLYFMNQWGMFDTARFDLASRLTMDIERKSFSKNDVQFNSNGSVSYYNRAYTNSGQYIETKINYGSKLNWTYKLTMNYPTDEEYEWLAELISSPQMYLEIEGYYYPVTIKNTNYEYSTNQNNGLKVLEIEVELNQTRYGFLR